MFTIAGAMLLAILLNGQNAARVIRQVGNSWVGLIRAVSGQTA